MPDYSVYITVNNKTSETLTNGQETHPHSEWVNFPTTIVPNQIISFQLKESFRRWFTGSSGTFSYDIIDQAENNRRITTFESKFQAPFSDPNTVTLSSGTLPPVYTASYRASVKDKQHWKDNQVDLSGHPVYVEFTLDYARKKRYKFKLMKVTAVSAHPVRNTRTPSALIVGDHVLWDTTNSSDYKDGRYGSYDPNVFAYTLGSSVPDNSSLNVTIRPLSLELSKAEVIVIGTIGGKEVFKSDFFSFEGPNVDVTVSVHVVEPNTSDKPFSINDDVDWGVRLRPASSWESLEAEGEYITRLELYWVAKTVHRALASYIPVNFLRLVVKSEYYQPKQSNLAADHSIWNTIMTWEAFYRYSKFYDTNVGEVLVKMPFLNNYFPHAGVSHFNLWIWGGYFHATRYAAPGGDAFGFNERAVNCMDQAAVVELSCTFGEKATSWLTIQPFGYINQTHLVGWIDQANVYVEVNNPFFAGNNQLANLPRDDPQRQPFGCHVFNAESRAWAANTRYGHDRPLLSASEQHAQLVDAVVASSVHPAKFFNWTRLQTWLQEALGNRWVVEYSDVSVGKEATQSFFKVCDSDNRDAMVTVSVDAYSPINEYGELILEGCSSAAKRHVRDLLMSAQRTAHGRLDFGRVTRLWTLIVLVSGHTVIDIRGLTSSDSLLPHALKLFHQTSHRDVSALILPKLEQKAPFIVGSQLASLSEGKIIVHGIYTRFTVIFTSDRMIATAKAASDGAGVLFDRYVVKDDDDDKGYEVTFFFITHKVECQDVRVVIADAETMISVSHDLVVEVHDTKV
ncbi:hypothetical protein H0H87_007570 [Tephrocybe sp. NHM501043]|nr:hypothetical protein H0H87_007570 [Tephrocybe sp. NHM501043]